MPNYSILIPDGESPFALHVVACLWQVDDIEVHILSRTPRALTRFSRGVRSFHLLKEGQSLLEGVAEVCSKVRVDLCMPVDMDGIYYFAGHRDQLEPPVKLLLMESAAALRSVWDKGALAGFLLANRFPHPRTITSREQFEKEIADWELPVLLKPRLMGGGTGIVKIAERGTLLETVGAQPDFFEENLLQEYLEGEDIDCSVLCRDGNMLAYTIQRGLFPNETSFQAAEAIEFLHHSEVLRITTELVSALKWNGVAHIDLRKRASDGQIVVIEINPRFWGSVEGSLHVGVNFPYLAALTSLGRDFPQPEFREEKYASAFSTLKRKLKNKPAVNLMRETNLSFYLYDPLPVLARLVGIHS